MASSLISQTPLGDRSREEEGKSRRCASARRPTRAQSPLGRKLRMQEELIAAAQARVAKEASRPKLLFDDALPSKARSPSSYVREAKARFSRRTGSTVSTRGASPVPRPSTALSRHCTSSEIALRHSSADSVIPSWVTQRDDFAAAYQRIKAARASDLEAICRKEASARTENEKIGLMKWAKEQPLLAKLQPEMLDRLQAIVVTEGTTEPQALCYVLRGCLECKADGVEMDGAAGEWLAQENAPFPDLELMPHEECALLRLRKSDLEQVEMSLFVREKRESFAFLSSCGYFSALSPLKVQRLSRAVEKCHFAKDAVIYRQSDIATSLYIVKEGEVALQLAVKVGQGYRWPIGRHAWEFSKMDMVYNLTLKTVAAGGFFGESELQPLARRLTSAKSLGSATVYMLPREKFLEVFTQREVSDLRTYGNLSIPSPRESVAKVLKQFGAQKKYKQTLVNAASVDCSCPDARETILDRHTRKMVSWLKNLNSRSAAESKAVRKDLLKVRKDRVFVRSVDMLSVAQHANEENY